MITGLIFHQTAIFKERGLSEDVAAAVFVAFAIASAMGASTGGLLIERIGPQRIFALGMTVMAAAVIMGLFMASPAAAAGYAALLGASAGISQVVMGRDVGPLLRTPPAWAGSRGSAVMIMISAAALGPLPLAALQGLFRELPHRDHRDGCPARAGDRGDPAGPARHGRAG